MARGVNKVILIGNLGADPDVRYTADGSAVVNFTMATNEPFRTPDGNWEERAEWHRVVVFGKTAEACGNYLSKGKTVYVEGKLRTRQWEDAQGAKRYTTEIVAREIQFLGGGDQQMPQAQNAQANPKPASAQQYTSRPSTEELPPPSGASEDDIPF